MRGCTEKKYIEGPGKLAFGMQLGNTYVYGEYGQRLSIVLYQVDLFCDLEEKCS